ncbi:hypothetical protein EHYA_00169 [Embleya hyalina]|uniref:Uncharacterized protein n=1 Tax=Embleya hyalina TaxID=516124 RepID=A0A401YD42_9ACTN|nr:hypothetical protein EHYA_00169 [Embleya hyalina]
MATAAHREPHPCRSDTATPAGCPGIRVHPPRPKTRRRRGTSPWGPACRAAACAGGQPWAGRSYTFSGVMTEVIALANSVLGSLPSCRMSVLSRMTIVASCSGRYTVTLS